MLNGGVGTAKIDVKTRWLSGSIWAFLSDSGDADVGVVARVQANIAEFSIGESNNRDYYDISNVVSREELSNSILGEKVPIISALQVNSR